MYNIFKTEVGSSHLRSDIHIGAPEKRPKFEDAPTYDSQLPSPI